jgi:hypothetical protein
MKRMIVAAVAAFSIVGCGAGGDTTVEPSSAEITVEPSSAEITIEPAPVEVVIIDNEEEPLPTELFAGVNDAYDVNASSVKTTVTMIDNKDIKLFNFIFIVGLDGNDILYSEPNTKRDDGRITVTDTFNMKEPGKYTISLVYYGEEEVKLTKHQINMR